MPRQVDAASFATLSGHRLHNRRSIGLPPAPAARNAAYLELPRATGAFTGPPPHQQNDSVKSWIAHSLREVAQPTQSTTALALLKKLQAHISPSQHPGAAGRPRSSLPFARDRAPLSAQSQPLSSRRGCVSCGRGCRQGAEAGGAASGFGRSSFSDIFF